MHQLIGADEGASLITTAAFASPPVPGTYQVDPARTTIELATRHMFGMLKVTATFRLREARLVVGEPASHTTVHAVIDAASFTSNNARRDADVRKANYLDVATYPDITVDVTSASPSETGWVGDATVTARGVAVPVKLRLAAVDQVRDVPEVRLQGSLRIDRYAHGITAGKGMAGRWMNITVTAAAVRI